ncbi:MAG TPA: hypothetical protein VF618_27735 [Thermoanaerobaculia bacterium]
MHRRTLALSFLILAALALPVTASQFTQVAFEDVASQSAYIVRGTIGPVTSAWDDSGETIFSYATVRVSKYFGETAGPDVLQIREVGGTVDGYTQQAVGFPTLREGQQVVLFLSKWDDSNDFRIHAYNQGKFEVRTIRGIEMATPDPVQQGTEGADKPARNNPFAVGVDVAGDEVAPAGSFRLDELELMISAAREGHRIFKPTVRE